MMAIIPPCDSRRHSHQLSGANASYGTPDGPVLVSPPPTGRDPQRHEAVYPRSGQSAR